MEKTQRVVQQMLRTKEKQLCCPLKSRCCDMISTTIKWKIVQSRKSMQCKNYNVQNCAGMCYLVS